MHQIPTHTIVPSEPAEWRGFWGFTERSVAVDTHLDKMMEPLEGSDPPTWATQAREDRRPQTIKAGQATT